MLKQCNFFALLLLFSILASPVLAQRNLEKIEKSYTIQGNDPFYLELDIDAGEVFVKRNKAANQIDVLLHYSIDEFEYDFDYSEKNRSLTFTFDKNDWVDTENHDGDAEIEIWLPENVELEFRSKIKAGAIKMEIGGLSLRDFRLKTFAGEVMVDFAEPNKIIMNTLDINIKVGETQLRNLGNARFRKADINNGIGALDIDFTGELPDDASASIDLDIGETDIILPDDFGVRLSVRKFLFLSDVNISGRFRKSGSNYYSENYDSKRKGLDLEVRPGIGELKVRYY